MFCSLLDLGSAGEEKLLQTHVIVNKLSICFLCFVNSKVPILFIIFLFSVLLSVREIYFYVCFVNSKVPISCFPLYRLEKLFSFLFSVLTVREILSSCFPCCYRLEKYHYVNC